MSFGSFLRGVVAQVNPFDNGKTYGSYNPPKKKRQEDQQTYQTQSYQTQVNQPTVQKPKNLLSQQSSQDKWGLGDVINPKVSVPQVHDYATTPLDDQANKLADKIPKPKQSFWGKVKDQFDANTEADKYRRTVKELTTNTANLKPRATENQAQANARAVKQAKIVGNTPYYGATDFNRDFQKSAIRGAATVPFALGRTVTGVGEGAADLTGFAGTAVNAPIQYVRHGTVSGSSNNFLKDATDATKDKIAPASRFMDRAAIAVGGKENKPFYEGTQIAANVVPLFLSAGTLAGARAASAAEKANLAARMGDVENAANLTSKATKWGNISDIIGGNSQSGLTKAARFLESLQSPLRSLRNAVTSSEDATKATNTIEDVLTNKEIEDIVKESKSIPVTKDIPVTDINPSDTNIPVRNATNDNPLIKEVGGDASTANTATAQLRARAAKARQDAFDATTSQKPDQNIEGVTPAQPEKPFSLDSADVSANQDKIVKEYADYLKSMGEGNGVEVNQATGTRITNNVRFGDTRGKRMTKADWIEEAKRQLDSGSADPAFQNPFKDANNPDVQQLLTQGEPVKPGIERPISVKKIDTINVQDKTNVPADLPETPGKVRVTESTAPVKAKSEALAAEQASAPAEATKQATTDAASIDKAKVAETQTETLPKPGESDEQFLSRQATGIQDDIKRAVASIKENKKLTSAERSRRAAMGQKAYEDAKAAGKSIAEQEAARKAAYGGAIDRVNYTGSPIHSADEQRLRDMIDTHYSDMPYKAGQVRDAFDKLFHSGEPGAWASEQGNHIVKSDVKAIRQFLNESVPEANLGDAAETAIQEISSEADQAGKIAKAIGLQRALRFTADISATGRQALAGAISHPGEFAQAVKDSFSVMFSHNKYQKLVSDLASNKEANYINDRLGAYLSVLNDDINKADDIYRNSEWAHKIPVVNKVVAASERQYNTLLSMMRYYGGKRFIDAAGGIGELEKIASDSGNPDEFLKAIGQVTNVNTGRGFSKSLDSGAAKVWSNMLVSPRGLAAKLQRFNPKYYTDLWHANPAAGKEAVRSLVLQTGLTLGVLGAAQKAGIVEDGQIKVGNTRYDLTGGASNIIRTAVRVAQYVSGNRETTPFNSAEDEVVNWAKNQLAPFISSSLHMIGIHQDDTGNWVDKWGNDVNAGTIALENLAPVGIEQTVGDIKQGVPGVQTAVNAGLNALGFGVNTYQNSADKAKASEQQLRQDNQGFEKYIPKDTTKLTHTVLNGVLDDAYYASDWDAYKQSAEADLKLTTDDQNSTKKQRDKAQLEVDRASFYQRSGYSPDFIDKYKGTTLSEWRAMGNPKSDAYDPEMYQKLWDIDQQMTGSKVSYKTGDPTKSKYYDTKKRSGSGGGKSKKLNLNAEFGTIGNTAPKVQQYQTISQQSGSVPIIQSTRPNIVHRISQSG